MSTVTISKKEYKKLVEAKFRYERLREAMEGELFAPPPTKNKEQIIAAFKNTNKYNQKFLESLKNGLEQSSYFRS